MAAPAMEGRQTHGPGFFVYLGLFVAAYVLCMLAGFGIGFLLLPIPGAMLVGLILWRWKPAVAGWLGAAAAGAITYVLMAPLSRFSRSSTVLGPEASAGLEGCQGTLIGALPLERCEAAETRALILALGAAALVGALAAMVTWTIQRWARRA